MSRGVVLVRSDQPEVQLQALRTLLSLSLGDRQADMLIAVPGLGVLAPPPKSEAEHCLQTLRRVGVGIELDHEAVRALVHRDAGVLPHAEFVGRLATAEFVQVF
ncbi:MAG TPA: hypothetical protein VGR61_01275 [Candidatus Dormibacteraeota bacterium]|nr:hypothetical protein [Candidatus Dormibacteraeota bacterium]